MGCIPAYVVSNPDMDPWDHYKRYGHDQRRPLSVTTSEGEVVSGAWSSDGYLFLHRDVANAGMDAWDHFAKQGWNENRYIAVLVE